MIWCGGIARAKDPDERAGINYRRAPSVFARQLLRNPSPKLRAVRFDQEWKPARRRDSHEFPVILIRRVPRSVCTPLLRDPCLPAGRLHARAPGRPFVQESVKEKEASTRPLHMKPRRSIAENSRVTTTPVTTFLTFLYGNERRPASYCKYLNPTIMETKAFVLPRWDDLVFEKRNKDYGAYVLRKLYMQRLILALGASTALMACMIVAPQLIPTVPLIPRIPPKITVIDLQPPPMVPTKPVPPPPAQQAALRQNQNTTIRVVTEQVEPPEVIDAPVLQIEPGTNVIGEPVAAAPAQVVVPEVPKFVIVAQVMPAYDGGTQGMLKYLGKKLRFPPAVERLKLEGTVFVSFIVNGDGSVSDVEVIKGFHPDADKEAMRVIASMPGWTGGRQNGNPVNVKMVLPIRFQLAQ
jgi:periplasmic protein TonB